MTPENLAPRPCWVDRKRSGPARCPPIGLVQLGKVTPSMAGSAAASPGPPFWILTRAGRAESPRWDLQQARCAALARQSPAKISGTVSALGLCGVELVIEKLDAVLLHQGKTQLLRLALAHRPHDIAGDLRAHLGILPGAVARRLELL